MGYFEYLLQKECFGRLSLLIINEGEICGIRSTERFDRKMSVQIIFSNLRLFRVYRVPCNISRTCFRNCFLCAIFLKLYQVVTSEVYLDWIILFDNSLILCGIRLDLRFKKQLFRVFRAPYDISSFFVKLLGFSVFLLISI